MARVARAGRFFGFGLAIYLLSYLYIYDIGVWTPPPASQGDAASLARFSGVSDLARMACRMLIKKIPVQNYTRLRTQSEETGSQGRQWGRRPCDIRGPPYVRMYR